LHNTCGTTAILYKVKGEQKPYKLVTGQRCYPSVIGGEIELIAVFEEIIYVQLARQINNNTEDSENSGLSGPMPGFTVSL
jgi:hypothetical protein